MITVGTKRSSRRILAALSIQILSCELAANAQVTTAQYGNSRTGATLAETILSPSNVNSQGFGKLFSIAVDGDVYAQPLYVPHLEISGMGKHNVLFVATEHDSVYAFDADAPSSAPLWKVSFLDPGSRITTVPPMDVSCPFIQPEIGISSTPVIDLKSGTIYVLARTKEHKQYVQRLHALDIGTGKEKFGGPVSIQASAERIQKNSASIRTDFDSLRENQRAALLLDRDKVYVAWASSCDVDPYHGWVIAYAARTLRQAGSLNTSPDGEQGGIWQGDAGAAADGRGNVFVVTGNGTFDAAEGGRDYGDSVLKLAWQDQDLVVRDSFTPFNQEKLNADDLDLGSSGPVLLPDLSGAHPHLLVVAGKGEGIYIVDRDRMGKYRPDSNSHAVQFIPGISDCFGAPAYWNHNIYYACENDSLKDFSVKDDLLSPEPFARSVTKFSGVGATPTISANKAKNGIVWIIATPSFFGKNAPAMLRAYDANNVAHELYNSEQNSTRDRAGIALRFSMPTVAKGRVYIGTKKEVDVYGLIPASSNTR
jgi:hypothetical protein